LRSGSTTKADLGDFTHRKPVADRKARKKIWQLNTTTGFAFDGVEPNLAHRTLTDAGVLPFCQTRWMETPCRLISPAR
jgi:hypothetical protein